MTTTKPKATGSNGMIDIGDRLELFVDRHIIDKTTAVSLRLHTPCIMPAPQSPLMGAYMTVIKDADRYRGYYRRYKPGFKGERKDGNRGECTCYAESRDGIEWVEPDLNLIAEDTFGKVKNAILDEPPFAHNFSPFLDTCPNAEQTERYKALAGTRGSGLHAFTSPDGIHWRKMQDEPVIVHNPGLHEKHAFDSQNVAFWSDTEQCYLCYFRHWKTSRGGPRTIGRARSEDFLTWRDESAVFEPPNMPEEELYTNQTHPYFRAPHIYIAFPTRFTRGYVKGDPLKGEDGSLLNLGSTDIMFMNTRAGTTAYERLFKEAFIRPGPDPAGWENRANYVALNVVPTGATEMSIYNRDGRRHVLRTDGFVSVNAPYAGGELLTKPLVYSGGELVLNLSTSIMGSVRVELQDADGNVLPGFALQDCEPMIDDRIDRVAAWRGGSDVSRHAGRPVRIRFVMQDSDLYSLRFR